MMGCNVAICLGSGFDVADGSQDHRCHVIHVSWTSSQVPMMVLLVATAASFTFLDLSLEASKILGKAETRKGSGRRHWWWRTLSDLS